MAQRRREDTACLDEVYNWSFQGSSLEQAKPVIHTRTRWSVWVSTGTYNLNSTMSSPLIKYLHNNPTNSRTSHHLSASLGNCCAHKSNYKWTQKPAEKLIAVKANTHPSQNRFGSSAGQILFSHSSSFEFVPQRRRQKANANRLCQVSRSGIADETRAFVRTCCV